MFSCLIILFGLTCKWFDQTTACQPSVVISATQNDICLGTTIEFHAIVTNNGTNEVYSWKRNNLDVSGSNTSYLASDFHDGDVVVCEYSCKTTCGVDTVITSNPVTVHVINDVEPVITIANNDSLICEGEWAVFTATAYYGNAVPAYQWLVNGNAVGDNSPVFKTNTITNGSRIECLLSISTPSCPGTKTASSRMNIYVYPMVHPAITITPSKTIICRGEEVRFTATANGGAYPSFSWQINGRPTGDVNSALSTSTLNDGDTVSCTITISQDSRCHTDSISAPSNKVVIHVRDFASPGLTIAAPQLDVCSGTPVTFTATAQNPGDYVLYQWVVNGSTVGGNSSTFINDRFKNGDSVWCLMTTNISGCPFTVIDTSNNELVKVRAIPLISFSPPKVSVLEGESAALHATVSGKVQSVVWSPATVVRSPNSLVTGTIPLTRDTLLQLAVTDSNGCSASKEIIVKVLHKLYMPSSFTPNNDGKNDVFRIPRGASLILENFSVFDRWGNVVFSTSDIARGWDGNYHGEKMKTGTYVYLVRGMVQDKEVVFKGTVTLIR